jgi:carbonic anhydrase
MSCPDATAPINISMANITGKCDMKCSYSFQYNNSSCVATNRGDYISISYDKSSSPPIQYNTVGYDVQEIRLYTPSLHSYNDVKTDGEFVIIHHSNTGAIPLLVCIPIKSNNSSSVSALFFKTLIDTMSSNAPSDGETTTVNVQRFNLNAFIPKKPFFSYSATEPYQPCSEMVEYIVFGPLEASLDINADSLTTLQSIISSHSYDIKSGPSLFFNPKGSRALGSGGGEIYIDCQPVDSSDETVDVVTDNGGSGSISIKEWLEKPFVKIIIMALIFIVLLMAVKYGLALLKPGKGIDIKSIDIINRVKNMANR